METTAEKASLCVAVGETAHSKDVARDWAESELPRGDLGCDRLDREWSLVLRSSPHSDTGHIMMEAESMKDPILLSVSSSAPRKTVTI